MIDIKNLDCSMNGRMILKGISVSFNDGETIGIIGKSGSGKTLLLKTIAGLTGRFPGAVSVNGSPLPRRRSEAQKMVSFHGAGLHPLNPSEVLLDFLLHARVPFKRPFSAFSDYDRQITEEYIGLLGLGPFRDEPLGIVPDGIFALAMLARTFIGEAYAVALDNPTNDLDIASVRLLEKTVGRYVINGDHVAVLCSNDLNFIAQTADRVLVMEGGRIAETGGVAMLDRDLIQRYFGIEVMVSKNVYNGRPEFHIFPDA